MDGSRDHRGTGHPVATTPPGKLSRGSARLAKAAMLAALALLSVPMLAGAVPPGNWILPATDLSAMPPTNPNLYEQQVAFGPDGSSAIVWTHKTDSGNVIQAATRPPGGSLSTPTDLSAPGQSVSRPQLEFGPDGTLIVVWTAVDGGKNRTQAAIRPPGGVFGQPVYLSADWPSPAHQASDPQVAFSSDGTATVIWSLVDGPAQTERLQAADRPPGGSFGAPVDITSPTTGEHHILPMIATGPDGAATVVWERTDASDFAVIQATTRPAGGNFGAPVDLSSGSRFARSPQIGIAADGTTTVVWDILTPPFGNQEIQVATRPPGGSFGSPVTLSAAGQSAVNPRLGVAPGGTATVVWSRKNGSNWIVQAATRPADAGSWTTEDLSATGLDSSYPQIAMAPDGAATAIWRRGNSITWTIQAASRDAGGSFGMPTDLSVAGESGYNPRIATAPDGTGITTAAWARVSGSDWIGRTVSTAVPDLALAVSLSGSGSGRVTSGTAIECPSTCSGSFPAYTELTLTATADPGFVFTGWGGACSGTQPTCQVRMNDLKNVTATFVKPSPPQPNNNTGVFDGKRLHIRLKCGSRYRPKCMTSAAPVTKKGRKGKPMAKQIKRKIRAGRWIKVTFLIKPNYRAKVTAMSHRTSKQLYVQQKIRSKRIGKHRFTGKKPRVVYHRYRVRSSG